MSNGKFLTIEDLITLFKTNKIYNFSSKETGKPIVVQSVQDFSSADIEESDDGKLYCKVRVCHTLLNRNKSFISEESMKQAMPSLKYAPLLAKIHQLDDGSWDFHAHDCHVETDENGNEYTVYDEQQIGTFTSDEPYFEYDEEMDKTYVAARVAIPEEYSRASDIIREKKGTKVSCELVVYDCSYNGKEKYLQLDNFRFNGCTCLGSEKDGTPIGEGMIGSNLTLEDFSENNNSIIKFTNRLNELQAKLDELEARFIINNSKEGGNDKNMDKFNELLEKYGKTAEDVNFEYEGLTDDELEAKFEEVFGKLEEDSTSKPSNDEGDGDESESEEEPEVKEDNACGGTKKKKKKCDEESDEEDVEDDQEVKEDNACGGGSGSKKKKKKKCSEENESMIRSYEISHDDIRYALYNLLSSYEELDNEWYYITGVYDAYFVYESCNAGKIYGQKYTKDNDVVAFDGERYILHKEYLTDLEYAEIQNMRSNYAELKAYKENTENEKLHAQREEIINSEKYAVLAEKNESGEFINEKFAKLVSEMDNYSLTDLEMQIKVIHSDYITEHSTFSEYIEKPEKKTVSKKQFSNPEKKDTKKTSRYGNLFSK